MFENAKWIYRERQMDDAADCEFPAPYFIRDFEIKRPIANAILNIAVIGEGAFFLDGIRIPDSFRPMHPTEPGRTVIYNTYDLTDQLIPGCHRLGVLAGNHRWRMVYSRFGNVLPTMIAQLEITYNDGTTEILVSDEDFLTADSPILFHCTLCGEIRDTRLEIPNWSDIKGDLSKFRPAEIYNVPVDQFSPHFRTTKAPPIRKMAEYDGHEIMPGIFDFGIITAGHARLTVSGKSGAFIKLIHGERLAPDGCHVEQSAFTPGGYPDRYNSDGYILNGSPNQVLESELSFHGMRYVEIIGDYDAISITAVTTYTDMPITSYFHCNNEILNQIHAACINSMQTCWQGMPLDNPKRDAAWLGDIMLDVENYAHNFSCYESMYEYVFALLDTQHETGYLPTIAPCCYDWIYDRGRFIGPDWGDSAIIQIVYYMYLYTHKSDIISLAFESMERTMQYFSTLTRGGLITGNAGTGDWSAVKETTYDGKAFGPDIDILSNCYYYLDAIMIGRLAGVIGKDSQKYLHLAEEIRNAFRKEYICEPNKKLTHISEWILSAAVGLLNEQEITDAVRVIADEIKQDNCSITFGVHGIRFFHKLLSDHGYGQLVFDVLTNTHVLGYGKNVADGLTALPERFNYDKTRVMSMNHHFFSVIDGWFVESLAGIRIDIKGNVQIKPIFVDGVDSLDAQFCGICVRYDKNELYIRSPQPYTLCINGQCEAHSAGELRCKR